LGLEFDWTKFFNRFEIRIGWAKDYAMFVCLFFFLKKIIGVKKNKKNNNSSCPAGIGLG
jgi:hypothetical protein